MTQPPTPDPTIRETAEEGAARERVEAAERRAEDLNPNEYPREEGDTTVLGPEIFASRSGAVICWKGENYIAQKLLGSAHLSEARANRIEAALDGLIDAAQPYINLAGPHEQLFKGRDLRNFDALSRAMNEARCALADS